MKYLYPKVIDTNVNIDNRGYLIETYKKKEIVFNNLLEFKKNPQ